MKRHFLIRKCLMSVLYRGFILTEEGAVLRKRFKILNLRVLKLLLVLKKQHPNEIT